MQRRGWVVVLLVVVAACGSKGSSSTKPTGATTAPATIPPATTVAPAKVEKAKPAPGTGNVQGKVVFDEKPATGVGVDLCEKFDQYIDGCSGQQYKAQTDSTGEYLITDVPPKTYAALTVDVFDTNHIEYAQSDILTPQTYVVAAGKTLFVDTTYLFKSDLQLVAPAASATVAGAGLMLQWQPYADAAYYLVSVQTSDSSPDPVNQERVSGTSYALTKPLPAGTYSWQVEAYDGKDHRLSQSADGIKFTVAGG